MDTVEALAGPRAFDSRERSVRLEGETDSKQNISASVKPARFRNTY